MSQIADPTALKRDVLFENWKMFQAKNVFLDFWIRQVAKSAPRVKVCGIIIFITKFLMERIRTSEINYSNHEDKCRICIKPFGADDHHIAITKSVEKRFHDLTQQNVNKKVNFFFKIDWITLFVSSWSLPMITQDESVLFAIFSSKISAFLSEMFFQLKKIFASSPTNTWKSRSLKVNP